MVGWASPLGLPSLYHAAKEHHMSADPSSSRQRRSNVRKAVILVAGLGTRLLPAAKSQPKEMLPVGRKPCVQYVVEEMVQAGIRQILFVTGRKKTSIEDYFDADPELERRLQEGGQIGLADEVSWLDEGDVRFFYTRQPFQRGTADAVRLAEDFVGEEPFVVAFGDTIVRGDGHANLVQRLIADYEATSSACAAGPLPLRRVTDPRARVRRGGCAGVDPQREERP